MNYVIRDGVPGDWAFVLSTWLRSHKNSGYGMKKIQDAAYFAHHHPIVEGILERGARLRLAVTPEDPNTILGYVVSEPHALHFVYVKLSFRKFGIATRLLSEAHPAKQYTHLNNSDECYALLRRLDTMSFNPYAVYERPTDGSRETAAEAGAAQGRRE